VRCAEEEQEQEEVAHASVNGSEYKKLLFLVLATVVRALFPAAGPDGERHLLAFRAQEFRRSYHFSTYWQRSLLQVLRCFSPGAAGQSVSVAFMHFGHIPLL
jgi:hypothetical protein